MVGIITAECSSSYILLEPLMCGEGKLNNTQLKCHKNSVHIYFILVFAIISVQLWHALQPCYIHSSYQQFHPITAMASSIRSDSNSIPLSLRSSRWSLDSEDLQRHAELQNIVYPQTHQAARLSLKHSHYFLKPFTIGDAVHFQESTQPFTFLGSTGKVTYDDVGQEEYEAEFQAPY
jgi:hypothetical protein